MQKSESNFDVDFEHPTLKGFLENMTKRAGATTRQPLM